MSRRRGKGSLAGLPMDPKAHYLENGKDVDAGAGMWAKPLQVAHAMSFHDDKRCKTFTEVIVTGPVPYVIGTRLYAHNGKIIRIDSLVTKKGDWLFNANSYLKYTTKEDWSPLYKYQLTEPKEMIRGANAYLDAFADKFTDIPWGTPCARLEGGAYTNVKGDPHASCEVGIAVGRSLHHPSRLRDRRGAGRHQRVLQVRRTGRVARQPHLPLYRRQDPRGTHADAHSRSAGQ